MVENIGQRRSRERSFRKKLLEQAQCVGRYMIGVFRLVAQNLASRDVVIVVIKWKLSTQKGI